MYSAAFNYKREFTPNTVFISKLNRRKSSVHTIHAVHATHRGALFSNESNSITSENYPRFDNTWAIKKKSLFQSSSSEKLAERGNTARIRTNNDTGCDGYGPRPFPSSSCSIQRIRVNVAGKVFEMRADCLRNFPNTLLGNAAMLAAYYDKCRDEYFFDRNREAFEGIAHFYQSHGDFVVPLFVPIDIFYEEVKFFGLNSFLSSDAKCTDPLLLAALEDELDQLNTKINHREHSAEAITADKLTLKKRFTRLKFFYNDDDEEDEAKVPRRKWQKLLWLLFEKPHSSLLARLIAMLSLTTVILSLFDMCMDTMSDDRMTPVVRSSKSKWQYIAAGSGGSGSGGEKEKEKAQMLIAYNRRLELFGLDIYCNTVFTIELGFRFLAAPSKMVFARDYINLIDLVAIVPFFGTLIFKNTYLIYLKHFENMFITDITLQVAHNPYCLSFLRILRLTRVLRVLKLSRHVRILKIMGRIFYECSYEFVLLTTFLGINIIIFSCFMYYIELYAMGANSPFISIPHTFWWAVISFTTIGYGDLIPHSVVGKFCGSFFITIGILIAFLPVPILSFKFERIYRNYLQMEEERKRGTSFTKTLHFSLNKL